MRQKFNFFSKVISLEMHTLLVDNHDSFSYNILHLLKSVKDSYEIRLIGCENINKEDILDCRRIILSPGPGLPNELPKLMNIISWAKKICPMLGICLGHQALAIHFGARLINLKHPCHGIQSTLKTTKTSLFENTANVSVARYHSWTLDKNSIPKELQITSFAPDGCIMSFQHLNLPIWGVQFHPESFMTTDGKQMINNFFKL